MKKCILFSLLFLMLSAFAMAQSGHTVQLTVSPATDQVSTSTYKIYKGAGACSSNPTMAVLSSTLTPTNLVYNDTAVPVGTYCYYATQVQNGQESAPTPVLNVPVPPNAPAAITVKITS